MNPEIEDELRAAGWTPGRRVDVEPWRRMFAERGLDMHPAAEKFLTEFGGLSVNVSGPGTTMARTPFEFDPQQCLSEEDRFLEWGADIGRQLYPLGLLDQGRFFLGIDERTEIYLVETWVATFGPAQEALKGLIFGIKPTVVAE